MNYSRAIFAVVALTGSLLLDIDPCYSQKWELTGFIGRRTIVSFDGERMYQGGLDNLWRSTDGGSKWTVISQRYTDRFDDILVIGRNAVMVGSTRKLLVSHDSAHTFSQASLSNGYHLLQYKGGFLVAGYEGVSLSTDGGDTWKLLTDSAITNPTGFSLAANGDTILCGTLGNGLLISTNAGASWRRQKYVGPNYYTDIYGVAIDNGRYYCATQSGTSYSSDGGVTWVRIDNGMPHPGSTTPSSRSIVAYGDTLIAGSQHNQIYRSLDHGANWSVFSSGLYVGAIAYGFKKHGTDLYAETTDGLYVLHQGSIVWKLVAGGITARESIAPARQINSLLYAYGRLYAATNNYGVCRSSDRGDTWERGYYSYYTNGLLYDEAYSLGVYDSEIVAMSNWPYHSSDSGRSWKAYREMSGDVLIVKDSLLIVGNGSRAFRTFNFGKTWDTTGLPISYDAHTYQLYFYGGGLFAATSRGICRSTDDGLTWKQANKGIKDTFTYAIAAKDGYFFAGTRDGLYRSTDLGITWSRSSVGLPDSFVTAIFTNDTLLIASTKLGPYRSTDLGLSWVSANEGIEGFPIASFTTGGGYIYASTWFTPFDPRGAYIFRAPLIPKSKVNIEHQLQSTVSVRPNSAQDEIWIKSTASGPMDVSVFNTLGTQMMQTSSERVDVSMLPSGVYYVRVAVAGGVETKRVVIEH